MLVNIQISDFGMKNEKKNPCVAEVNLLEFIKQMWSQTKTHFMGPPHLYEKFISQINTDWYFRREYNILVCAYFEKERIGIN